tara:strand:+ start:8760 stop:9185 length:426 start_codon:yes stop_codon:yes gene_type:complete
MTIIENLSELSLQYFALLRQISSKYELTLSQSLILLSTPFDGITISELSDKLGIDISTMTRNIQRIEKKKLLQRNQNPDDKRSIKIELSKRGSTLAESINFEISNNIQKIINQYDLNISNQIKNNLENLSWDMYLFRKNLK